MNKIYFTKDAISFYEALKQNNNKEWFAENRYIYDTKVIPQAKEYIMDMGQKLKSIVPDINYAPKIDGSIFRIHKDARINKGKAPFKTHLGIIFWTGNARLSNPCFYLHIEPPFYYTGVGIARFSPEILSSYRFMVNSKKYQNTLINIKNTVQANYFNILGDKLKNVPKGIEPVNHTAAQFLKYKSIYINDEMPINKDFYSDNFFSYTFDIFSKMKDFFIFLANVCRNTKSSH